MEFDQNLVQRAQMLLTLEHPLSQVKEMLICEGYPSKQVYELLNATEEALNYLAPPQYPQNKIGIDILYPGEQRNEREVSVDILVDKRTGKLGLVTPQRQETWKVANEIRKAIKKQREGWHRYLH